MSEDKTKEKVKEKKDNRIYRRLSAKVIYLLIGMALTLTIAILLIGTIAYQRAIAVRYDEVAYQVADTAMDYFTREELVLLRTLMNEYEAGRANENAVDELMEKNERIRQVKDLMDNLRESFGANDIYLCVISEEEMEAYTPEAREAGTWKPIHYIMDSYHDPSENMPFGGRSGIIPEYREAILESIRSGERTKTHLIANTKWGYNMSAILPVVFEGETIAAVGVEIPMKTIEEDVISFIIRIAIVAGIIMILAVLLGWFRTRRLIVRPIQMVANEANSFISKETKVSDKLSTIKTRDEIQMLSESLLTMELSINDYIENIKEITAEKERIGAELNVATRIQASMLPTDFDMYNALQKFTLHASMTPAKEVGGDFYDFFLVDGDHLALVIADVSGKGVPAALFMVRAMTAIRTRTLMGGSPSEILGDVNDQLCVGNEEELFVTVWLAIINLTTGEGLAANAGHEHPALCHTDGTFEMIKYKHSPAVATMEGLPFREHEFKLEHGDTIFVYTDGVTEATDAHDELFGEDRVVESLNQEPAAEPEKLLKNVKGGIDTFVGSVPQFDDITMLSMHYL